MNGALKLVAILLLASVVFATTSSTASAEDKSTDYCTQRLTACKDSCSNYKTECGCATWRSVGCNLECSIAYAGCMMTRFRQG